MKKKRILLVILVVNYRLIVDEEVQLRCGKRSSRRAQNVDGLVECVFRSHTHNLRSRFRTNCKKKREKDRLEYSHSIDSHNAMIKAFYNCIVR